jgi:hypothetical protein
MNESRLDKLSPLSGVVAVFVMLVGVLVFNNYDFLPPAEEVAGYLNSNPSRVYAGGYIASLSSFFLIWFAGSLRSMLAEREGGRGSLSMIAYGGGVAAAVVLGISFVGILTAGLRAGAPGGITPEGAITMFDMWGQLTGQLFAIFMAVFIIAVAAISLRTGFFPSWFGWASVIIALGLLTPFAYMVLSVALLWLLVVSLWLYIKPGPLVQATVSVESA